MTETRRRRRIREAVESRGYQAREITWEPWYNAGEKAGIGGGWTVVVDRPYLDRSYPGDDLFGLSVEEVLAEVDYWLQPSQPCDCDRQHSAMVASRLINDPEKPTHVLSCEFHISYRLPWWGKREAAA